MRGVDERFISHKTLITGVLNTSALKSKSISTLHFEMKKCRDDELVEPSIRTI